MNILPHRYPFLFLDRAYGLDNPAHVVGFKNVAGSEMFVAATEHAEFMGYLQIEAGAQLGCAALLNQPAMQGKLGFFMSIDEAVFHRPVLAGSRIWMEASCEQKGTFGIATGKFYVGSELVTEAQIKFAIVDKTN
jgi:3-hydroxyacyl-[acyl-carrier-protein] dehydratase